jgi:alpha-glucosidase (family GH31 glycosyl hydrolase)
VGGKIPMMPRRNAGVWFTRWYDYAAPDVVDLVGEFEQRGLPLDVLVLDMNWHKKKYGLTRLDSTRLDERSGSHPTGKSQVGFELVSCDRALAC